MLVIKSELLRINISEASSRNSAANYAEKRKIATIPRIYNYRGEKNMILRNYNENCLFNFDLGDKRLDKRAKLIFNRLRNKYGQPLSKVFNSDNELKRSYEFFYNRSTSFQKIVKYSHDLTGDRVKNLPLILAVGDTTFLDYKKIKIKTEEYGPIGNGGNGLILHSCLAINPNCGQPLGLLWQKLWKRERKVTGLKKKN